MPYTEERRDELFNLLTRKIKEMTSSVEESSGLKSIVPNDPTGKMRDLLLKLSLSFKALEKGEYGKCFSCGAEIEIEVLQKNFQAIRCNKCYGRVTIFRKVAN